MVVEKLKTPRAPYTFYPFDKSIHDVELRYKIPHGSIWRESQVLSTFRETKSAKEFAALIEEKARQGKPSRLILPVPDSEKDLFWDTRKVKGQYANLLAVCDDANLDPLRKGAPALTPAMLWAYAVNADLRAKHLADFWVEPGLKDDHDYPKL